MNEIIVTHIDSSNWQNGLNWLRQVKSNGLSATVLASQLDDQQRSKISELGFPILPVASEYNDDRDVFICLNSILSNFDRCLFCKCYVALPTDLPKNFDVVVAKNNIELFDLVLSIGNLYDRAKAYKIIDEKIFCVKNQLLSSNFIYGTKEFWQNFISFLRLSYDEGYVEKRDFCDDLALNLHIAFFESLTYEVLC